MDAVEFFSAQWAVESPGIDVEPLEAWGRLKRTANLFDKIMAEVMGEFGLSLGEFEVLAALTRGGSPYEMRPTELTRALIITAGAVTARLGTLEKRGLISRRRHGNDGRVQLVILTAEGYRVFQPALKASMAKTLELLDGMDPQERARLHSSLKALMGAMESFEEPLQPIPDTETVEA
jgi:DNA-binding MarR family transcriptional regulator